VIQTEGVGVDGKGEKVPEKFSGSFLRVGGLVERGMGGLGFLFLMVGFGERTRR